VSTKHAARDPVAELEAELLGRLGLGPDATAHEVAGAHAAIVAYVAEAPAPARGWARSQAAAADEAFALLSDPPVLRLRAQSPSAGASAADPKVSPPKAVRRARAVPVVQATEPPPSTATQDDLLDDLIAEVTPSAHRDEVARPRPVPRSRPATSRWGRLGSKRVLGAAIGVAAVAAVLVAVSGFADSSIPSAPGPAASQEAAAMDESALAGLMERIQADPTDTEALMALGDTFFAAGQYDVAAEWLGRLVAIQPDDTGALLALGAAQFNSGDAAGAEVSWVRVIELDPGSVEAHYDLGYLYLNQDPPDFEGMQREWQAVVDLAPGTEVAARVQPHLSGSESAAPSAASSEAAP
jgi:tetratricopeptide (TPR) repeat protein